jgi:hypothetical protein
VATNHPHRVVSIRWGSTSNEQEIHHDQQYSFTATSSTIRSDSDDSGILRHGRRTEQRFGLLTEAISEDPKVVWTGWPTLLRPDDHTLDLEEAPALSRSCATLMTHRMGGSLRKSSSAAPVFIRIEQGQVHSRRKKDVSFELSRLAASTRCVKPELSTAQGRVRTSWFIGGAACAV